MEEQRIEYETQLAKKIEAGLIAQEILDGAPSPVEASENELRAIVGEGIKAKEDLVLSNLGLVTVIAAEAARINRSQFNDLCQEGCLALQQAVMSYDWRKGGFGPYAGMWVRTAVRRVNQRSWVPIDDVVVSDPTSIKAIEHGLTRDGLAQVLENIPSNEGQVLRLRTGWDGQPHSRKDVASQLGISVSRVRRLERMGIESVRRCWLDEAA